MQRAKPTPGNFDNQQANLTAPVTRRAGGSADATAKLRSDLRQQPENPALHFALARLLVRNESWREAEYHLRQVIHLDPAHRRGWEFLGTLLERRRVYTDAARVYTAATGRFPGNAGFWIRLGRSLRRDGQSQPAIAALSEAVRLAPESAEAQYEMGLGLHIEGKLEDARRWLHEALLREPANVMFQAAWASVEAALTPPGLQGETRSAARVGLHMNKIFHYSIMEPLFQALKTKHPVLLASEPALLQNFHPQVVVVADAQGQRLRKRFPDAVFIFVRHGLATKRHLTEAAAGCDFVAGVSSDTIRDEIVSHFGIRAEQIWVTGHVPMDPLFRGQGTDPGQIPLPRGNKTVLFAPTWNRRLSAFGLLGPRVVELLRGTREDINLIIKPHPSTLRDQPDWMSQLRTAIRGRKNVWLVDDPANDGMGLLPLADVLVSDASSLIFAFLACDRPVVLVTHPQRKQDPAYDENGIEWRWRAVGDEVTDIETLPAAIARGLQQPDLRATERAHYRQLLFGNCTDGCAAERIAARIGTLPLRDSAQR